MAMPAHGDVLAEIFTATATEIENADYHVFVAGPRIWGVVGRVLYDLYGYPATAAIARRAGVEQAQHWDADKATVVKTLLDLAAEHTAQPGQLDLFREESTEHRITRARRVLAEVLGWPAEDGASLDQIARETARDMDILRRQNEKLRAELAESRAAREG